MNASSRLGLYCLYVWLFLMLAQELGRGACALALKKVAQGAMLKSNLQWDALVQGTLVCDSNLI